MSDRMVLRTVLGKHARVEALRDGSIESDRVKLAFSEFDPLPPAFRVMVRGSDPDVCEMALVTHLLAHQFGKPITALPIPLWSRLHHANLLCAAQSDVRGPSDLAGRKVGVRAYSQTTGVWIRGILEAEYGLDLDTITWVTKEGAHVSEYRDPPNVIRDESGRSLRQLLLAGEVAAIMGERDADPAGVRSVIPDAETAAVEWSRRTGVFPVNHVLSVRTELVQQHLWLAGELMALFEKARRKADGSHDVAPAYGLEPNRRSIEMLIGFAARQKLASRAFGVDEIFPATLTP